MLHSNEDVVVIEAALLIQANWVEECHELWACIIPPNEVSKNNFNIIHFELYVQMNYYSRQ